MCYVIRQREKVQLIDGYYCGTINSHLHVSETLDAEQRLVLCGEEDVGLLVESCTERKAFETNTTDRLASNELLQYLEIDSQGASHIKFSKSALEMTSWRRCLNGILKVILK